MHSFYLWKHWGRLFLVFSLKKNFELSAEVLILDHLMKICFFYFQPCDCIRFVHYCVILLNHSSPVVLKRHIGSIMEKFLIPGRKFVPEKKGGKCGWKKFLLFVYSTHIKLHNEVGLDGDVYSTQGQTALPAVTDVIKVSLVHNYGMLLHSG